VPAEIDHCAACAAPSGRLDCLIDGVAFADAADVEAHSFDGEADGMVGVVKDELFVADSGFRVGDLLRRGGNAVIFGFAKQLDERADGDVECAVGEPAELDASLDDLESRFADLYGAGECAFVDAADFGVLLVVAHQVIDFADLGEGCFYTFGAGA